MCFLCAHVLRSSELIAVGSNSRLFFGFLFAQDYRNVTEDCYLFLFDRRLISLVCVCVYIRMISHSVPGIYEGPNQSGQSADEEKEKRSRSHLLFSLEIFLFSILVLCV